MNVTLATLTCTANGGAEGLAEAAPALHDRWQEGVESNIQPGRRRWLAGLGLTSSCLLNGVSE